MKYYYYLISTFLLVFFAACTETPTEPEPDINNITVINDVSDSVSIAQQLASLNEAGAFYNVNMKILEGTSPIEGAEVKLTSSLDGEIIETIATSDANGNVVFDGITIGGNIIEISKEGFYSALGLIDFKFERGYNYEIIDDVVAPITKNESAIIPLYSAENSSMTAVINGKVIIETDLTNNTPEVLSNQLIKADFSGNIAQVSEGINFQAYSLNVEGGLGEAVTDENGLYSILVPTGNTGINVDIIIPEFQLKQKLAFLDPTTEEPTLDSVYTTFSANVSTSNIPDISGIKTIIPDPAPEGRGLKISNIRKAGRPLFTGSSYYYQNIESTGQQKTGYNMTYFFDGGEGYQSTPKVVITDETGSDAVAQAKMGYAIKSINVDSIGQYNANSSLSYRIRAYYDDSYSYYSNYSTLISGQITTDENGHITQTAIDKEFENAFLTSDWFGDKYENINTVATVDSIVFELPYYYGLNPVIISIDYDAKVKSLHVLNSGTNYLNPSITFEGGTPTRAASFEISDYKTPWTFDFDNSTNSNPYVAVPKIDIEFFNGIFYDIDNQLINEDGEYSSIYNSIISENGEIKFINGATYKTNKYALDKPEFYITEPIHTKPQINFSVNDTYLYYYYDGYYYQQGRGYKEKFDIQILPQFEEISGAGANVTIVGGRKKGDEYQWLGELLIQNRGSGYLNNVNQTTARSFNMSNTTNNLFLKAGETKLLDIDYGTGYRSEF